MVNVVPTYLLILFWVDIYPFLSKTISHPSSLPLVLVYILTSPKLQIANNASPLKPKDYKFYKSSNSLILEVAPLFPNNLKSFSLIPTPLSLIIISFNPYSLRMISIFLDSASILFSINSLIQEAKLEMI